MLVFLDFDGVLRREGSDMHRLEAPIVARFEGTLRAMPGAGVVIASSWRTVASVARMRTLFAPDVAARVEGATPHGLESGEHERHREVLAYLEASSAPDRAWVAIDDQHENYPPRANVLIVDPLVGFDQAASDWLLAAAKRYGAL